jgi:ABC-type dipeptide/oligopeptide/nickel transport system permease component
MTRSFMLEQLSSEYVTTARVKGLSEWQVIWGHAFRNIRVQLITVIALSYAGLLEGLGADRDHLFLAGASAATSPRRCCRPT